MRRIQHLTYSTVVVLAALAGSAGSSTAQDSKAIVIGSALPFTGPLQCLGAIVREANEQGVADISAAGGIDIGGIKRRFDYKILDNQSDPNLVTRQARTLVLEQGAVALLGSFTSPAALEPTRGVRDGSSGSPRSAPGTPLPPRKPAEAAAS